MKNNLLIVLILFLIFSATGWLFEHGDRVINKQANQDFAQMAFVNLENNFDSKKDNLAVLQIFINNRYLEKTAFEIKWHLEGALIDEKTIEISSGEKVIIKPTEKIKKEIENISKETVEYEVVIGWKKNTEKLKKQLIKK